MAEPINRLKEILQGDPEAESEVAKAGWLKTHNNMSVEKFAREIGVTRTSVYFYLNNRSRPTRDTLVKICKILGIPMSEGVKICTPRESGRQPKD
jgi:transcriptional regulator with XRE-family HTH domain